MSSKLTREECCASRLAHLELSDAGNGLFTHQLADISPSDVQQVDTADVPPTSTPGVGADVARGRAGALARS
jgi:Asp-tRNA(Asn)/Glu-tRNA(Gln) amidotransferase C subunit